MLFPAAPPSIVHHPSLPADEPIKQGEGNVAGLAAADDPILSSLLHYSLD